MTAHLRVRHAAAWIVGATAVATAALVVLLPPGPPRGALYQLLLWSSVGAILLAVRVHRPPTPSAWRTLALANAVLAGSALLDDRFWRTAGPVLPVRAGDLLAVTGFGLLGLGALRFSQAQSSARDRGPVIDSLLVAIAVPTVLAEGIGPGAWADPQRLVGYLILLVCAGWVTAMTTRVLLAGGYRTASGWLLAASSVATTAGCGVLLVVAGTDEPAPSLLVGTWSLALLLTSASALHPSMRRLTAPTDVEAAHVTSRMVLPGIAVVAPPMATLVTQLRGGTPLLFTQAASMSLGLIVVLRLASLVAERERARVVQRERALHDPLTGLANRSALESRFARLAGGGQDLALLFIDLDGFKAVNDEHGHAEGDVVLRRVGDLLAALAGPGDLVVRLAGDEFAVLTAAGVGAAEELAARVRREVPQVARPHVIGASVGVGHAPGGAADLDVVLRRADHEMYAEKRRTVRTR